MRVDRSEIRDADGRHIPVTRTRLSPKPKPPTPAEPPLRAKRDFRRKLDELASRVRRMSPPLSNDPERFHVERSEIARELQKLAELLR